MAESARLWDDVFSAAGSRCFGISADGKAKNAHTLYTVDTSKPADLSFDVSNHQILASVGRSGSVESAIVVTGILPGPRIEVGPGIPSRKDFIAGGPWRLDVELQGETAGQAPAAVDLIADLFPVSTCALGGLTLRRLVFAPLVSEKPSASPRAVIAVLQLENNGATEASGSIAAGGTQNLWDADARLPEGAQQAALCMDGATWSPKFPRVSFRLSPGAKAAFAFAFLLGRDAKDLRSALVSLRAKTAREWLNETWSARSARLGALEIPDDPFFAESLVRLTELCRQSTSYLPDGLFGGGYWGSNVRSDRFGSENVWAKDLFYEVLPAAMLNPSLCADAIPFFLEWGMVAKPFGRGLRRFPDAGIVTHSLSHALTPFILAGEYYRATGDRDYFASRPEILAAARERFAAIVASRRDSDPWLFPSMYVSDGDAEGDFHTGSNVLVWFSLTTTARIARDVHGEERQAREWEEIAAKVRADIRRCCVGEGPEGPQFFEGANRDGSFARTHDGEESDVGLMPFYGFCEADDPALTASCRVALSEQNPYYIPATEGIGWDRPFEPYGWYATTFPGFTTGLSGAADEKSLESRLRQIAGLTDLDGSFWWWPYVAKVTDPPVLYRYNGAGKCGWAAGVYVSRFLNDVLGLRVDVPARRFSLRPFTPWSGFSWRNCRMGSSLFDVSCERRRDRVVARVVNRNRESYACVVELMLPPGVVGGACLVNGRAFEGAAATRRFGRPAMRVERPLAPGGTLTVEAPFS